MSNFKYTFVKQSSFIQDTNWIIFTLHVTEAEVNYRVVLRCYLPNGTQISLGGCPVFMVTKCPEEYRFKASFNLSQMEGYSIYDCDFVIFTGYMNKWYKQPKIHQLSKNEGVSIPDVQASHIDALERLASFSGEENAKKIMELLSSNPKAKLKMTMVHKDIYDKSEDPNFFSHSLEINLKKLEMNIHRTKEGKLETTLMHLNMDTVNGKRNFDLDHEISEVYSGAMSDYLNLTTVRDLVVGAKIMMWREVDDKPLLLLVKERPNKLYDLPGGKCENKENIKNCLVREMFEETFIKLPGLLDWSFVSIGFTKEKLAGMTFVWTVLIRGEISNMVCENLNKNNIDHIWVDYKDDTKKPYSNEQVYPHVKRICEHASKWAQSAPEKIVLITDEDSDNQKNKIIIEDFKKRMNALKHVL